MNTILLLGRDWELLRIRKMLVECDGHRVFAATCPESLDEIRANVELLVLCHSLRAEEAQMAADIASELWPGIEILLVVGWRDDPTCCPRAKRFYTCDGPAALLGTIARLLPANPLRAA